MPRFSLTCSRVLAGLGCLILPACDASSSTPSGTGGNQIIDDAGSGGVPAGGASGGSSSAGTAVSGGAGSSSSAGSSASGASTGGSASGASAGGSIGSAGTAGSSVGSGCDGALICEDFEAYSGTPGDPWKVTKNAAGNVIIDGAQHRSGTKAVKVTTSGAMSYQQAFVSLEKIFPVAGNAFYGRMMIYATKAANDGVHWTMIEGEGANAAQGITNAQVRYGGQHEQRLMANYDSTGKKSDCWKHSATKMPEAKWACMEWYFDGATNTQKFWLDGAAIDDITVVDQGEGCVDQGTAGKWIYPSFSRLNLGWASYQTDDPREVWIDDVAVSTTKIGCPP
jgi:hypothetical protein